MRITFSPSFKKAYSKRIKNNKKLVFVVTKRIEQFKTDPDCLQLHNHQLVGSMKGLFSFSVNGDMRIIYEWINKETVLFLDIGSHNQVY